MHVIFNVDQMKFHLQLAIIKGEEKFTKNEKN